MSGQHQDTQQFNEIVLYEGASKGVSTDQSIILYHRKEKKPLIEITAHIAKNIPPFDGIFRMDKDSKQQEYVDRKKKERQNQWQKVQNDWSILKKSNLEQLIEEGELDYSVTSNRKRFFWITRTSIAVVAVFVTLFGVLAYASSDQGVLFGKILPVEGVNYASGTVAGATDTIVSDEQKYREWSNLQFSEYIDPNEDTDEDQLSNIEEYKLDTDPNNKFTCSGSLSDGEKLSQLIDPKSCKEIDVTNPEEVQKFRSLVDIDAIRSRVFEYELNQPVSTKPLAKSADNGSLLQLFNVSSLEELQKVDLNGLETQAATYQDKLKVAKTIERINNYINQSRSVEPYDRNYVPPVNGAVYLEVSIKYNVPLKYTLAIAQRESRFGTDRFRNDGTPTRPGQYKNIFSLGLTDGGQNLGFDTWEQGVEAFGKWYQKMHQKGVKDCQKWRIYNPNGDYCQRVESLANVIQNYLDQNN